MLAKIKNIPSQPGCYLFKNEEHKVLYVGKAKNLQKRVKSYWRKNVSLKIKKMLTEVIDVEYITVTSETEALILELNLIKQYNPKYNVLMRDDKSYPYIELTNDSIPILQVVRRLDKQEKRGYLFGPYPNVEAARETVNLLNRLYPLRKCRKIPKKPCLYFHIEQCWGYCVTEISEEQIAKMVHEIKQFLQNKPQKVIAKLENLMQEASANLNYEQAEELKKLREYVKMTTEKQEVEINDLRDIDIVGYYYQEDFMAIQMLFLRGGKIVATNNKIFEVIGNEKEQLQQYIVNFYEKNPVPQEILISLLDNNVLGEILQIKVKKPLKGSKRKLLNLAEKNAQQNLINKMETLKRKNNALGKGWEELQTILNLPKLERIELFDNSTLFGQYAVAGMVVYEHMQPLKKEYRKFKVNNKGDDVANLREVIYRRYYRVLVDKLKKPDLIMVDGGIAQVKAAQKVLEEFNFSIPVVGIKKDKKHQTNMIVLQNEEGIKLESQTLYNLVASMQDEVHRFAINYHRKIRSKGSLASILDEIPGIGPKRKKVLIDNYQTITAMQQASMKNLTKIIPQKVAETLKEKLQGK